MGEITNRDAILNKVSVLFEKMHQNQKLQQLAEQNNLDIKNTIKLTDDNMMNVAVTLVALSLAKEANDPRYKKLVNTGLQKRSLKLEIINDYKKEANDIIKDYSSGNFNKESIQEGFFDRFKPKTTGGNSIKHYYITTADEMNDVEQNFKLKFPEDFKKGYGDLYDKIGDKTINCKIDNTDRTGKLSKELMLTGNENVIIIFNMDEDYIGLDTSTGKYYLNPVMKNDSDMGELMFNNFKEFKKCLTSEHPTFTLKNQSVQEQVTDDTLIWKREASKIASEWVNEKLPDDVREFLNKNKTDELEGKSFEVDGKKFTFEYVECYNLDDYIYEELVKGYMLPASGNMTDTDEMNNFLYNISTTSQIPYIPIVYWYDDNDREWTIEYDVVNRRYNVTKDRGVDKYSIGSSWDKFIKTLK